VGLALTRFERKMTFWGIEKDGFLCLPGFRKKPRSGSEVASSIHKDSIFLMNFNNAKYGLFNGR
jgi:hypothetical protein